MRGTGSARPRPARPTCRHHPPNSKDPLILLTLKVNPRNQGDPLIEQKCILSPDGAREIPKRLRQTLNDLRR